jgi:hypothetical protein
MGKSQSKYIHGGAPDVAIGGLVRWDASFWEPRHVALVREAWLVAQRVIICKLRVGISLRGVVAVGVTRRALSARVTGAGPGGSAGTTAAATLRAW